MSDYYSEQSRAASSGRAGADRMAAGLGICVDKDRGDLDEVLWLRAEIARLREERKPVALMPLPFEPWRHGPLSYLKCEMIAALKKAGVKWRPLPPGPETKEPNRE